MEYQKRREEQSRQTEQRILRSALELMRERGYEKVSIRDICAHAEVTTGAFYHHFPSKEALVARGFGALDHYVEQVVTNVSEVQMAISVLREQVDAIFVPNDSVIQTAMAVVADSAAEYGIPVYGSSAVMVESGAFATISIGDRDIGAITADMLHQYLTGTPIEEIPAVVVDEFTMVINQTTADMIGAAIPADVLETAVVVK